MSIVGGIGQAGQAGRLIPSLPMPGEDDEDKGFGAVLGRALGEVNRLQIEAHDAATALAAGKGDLQEVVVAVQRADVAFQLVVQIRNKLLEAYQEVMRMPV